MASGRKEGIRDIFHASEGKDALVDTLVDVVVFDEAHESVSAGWRKLIDQEIILGLAAPPWVDE